MKRILCFASLLFLRFPWEGRLTNLSESVESRWQSPQLNAQAGVPPAVRLALSGTLKLVRIGRIKVTVTSTEFPPMRSEIPPRDCVDPPHARVKFFPRNPPRVERTWAFHPMLCKFLGRKLGYSFQAFYFSWEETADIIIGNTGSTAPKDFFKRFRRLEQPWNVFFYYQ